MVLMGSKSDIAKLGLSLFKILLTFKSQLIISAKRTDQDHHGIIDMTAFNTDGFDVSGRNVWIHDCNVWDQDDCIAVKVNLMFLCIKQQPYMLHYKKLFCFCYLRTAV